MNAMRQDAQKQSRKFCRSKEGKNSETHPEKPEKGETGCVLGAGENGSGWERVKPDEKTRKARRKSRDGLVSAAASVGAGRSPPATSAPRHAVLEWMWESALGERGRGSVARFPTQVRGRTVLVWCYGKFSGPKRAKKSGKSPKKREILLTKTDTVPIL